MTAHELLIQEHQTIRQLVAAVHQACQKKGPALAELFPKLQDAVRRHLQKEDTLYYAAIDNEKKASNRPLMHDLRNDHAAVIFSLESLAIKLRKGAPLEEWKKRFDSTVDVLTHHFEQEEKELFAKVHELASPEVINAINEKIKHSE